MVRCSQEEGWWVVPHVPHDIQPSSSWLRSPCFFPIQYCLVVHFPCYEAAPPKITRAFCVGLELFSQQTQEQNLHLPPWQWTGCPGSSVPIAVHWNPPQIALTSHSFPWKCSGPDPACLLKPSKPPTQANIILVIWSSNCSTVSPRNGALFTQTNLDDTFKASVWEDY